VPLLDARQGLEYWSRVVAVSESAGASRSSQREPAQRRCVTGAVPQRFWHRTSRDGKRVHVADR